MSDSGLLRCSLTRNPISSVANPCCNRVLVGVVPAVVKAMRRRDFIEVIAGSIAALPLAARAQAGKMPIIGLMGSGTQAAQSQWTSAFLDRLRELGWTEGRNIAIEYRWAEGRNERFAEIADEFVRLKVDVIVTHNTPGPLAAKTATSVIPIVFATAGDPVGTGIVASLARPGGNVTGLSGQAPDIAERRLEFLREVVPGLRRLGYLSDVDNPLTALEKSELQKAARTLAIEVAIFGIRRNEDIAAAFEAFRDRVDALYVAAHPTIFMNRIRINTFALAARLPTMYTVREYVEAGGLMSYGPNWPSMWRRAADLVDKILHGTKPADIPVEQPTRFDLVLNLTTAKALGFKIPDKLLALADEVIE
jgi:putative tryptophan/tyrosine transport system substrate-binding protein